MENPLFEKHHNHEEINQLVKLFKPVLNIVDFDETKHKWYDSIAYVATTDDNWSITATFETDKAKGLDSKYYYPVVEFEKNRKQDHSDYKGVKRPATPDEEIANKLQAEKIMEHFQKIYKPDFKRAMEIIEIYLQQGINTGIYNSVKVIPHNGDVSTQFYRYENTYNGYNRLFFNSRVAAKITFNNVLQTLRANETKFKKSHLSIDFLYLISKDNKINPYFKIKLPYSSHKKIHCILSFDCSKMYFVSEDSHLKEDYIDNLKEHPTDNAYLELFFRDNFKKEIINVISKTLKIKRTELVKMTDDELKSHFILIEMVKF